MCHRLVTEIVVNLMLFKVDVLIYIAQYHASRTREHDKFYNSPIKLVLCVICIFFVFSILLNSLPSN
jgi:hypothetical protein